MAQETRDPDPQDEQQAPEHSPVEEEFRENESNTPSGRDATNIFGSTIGLIFGAIFILFILAVIIYLFIN